MKMRKIFSIMLALVMLVSTLTGCGVTKVAEVLAQEDLVESIEKDKKAFYSDYETDYIVIDGPHMDEPLVIPVIDYMSDIFSSFPIEEIRYIDFSKLESLETAAAWKEAADKYCLTAEDVIVLKAASYLNILKAEDRAGSESVPLTWITDFEDNEFDFSTVNAERLRYKLEVLAHAYGYTTCGRTGIGVDSKEILRVWYNFYSLEAFPEVSPIFDSDEECTVI